MESDMELRAENICRTCMCESSNMTSLFAKADNEQHTLSSVLSFLTNITVRKEDRLPKQVCEECQIFINKTEAFRKRCLETEAKLCRLLNDSKAVVQNLLVDEKSQIKHEITIYADDVSANSSYQCSICLTKFTSLDLLKTHVTVCTQDKKDRVFVEIVANSGIEEHPYISSDNSIRNSSEDIKEESYDDYSNTYYDEDFDSSNELKQENLAISEDITYNCLCKSVFHNIDEFKTHMETSECSKNVKDIKNINLFSEYKNKLFCQKCNISFSNAKSYRRHQKKHNENQLYQCSMCMRRFKTKPSLIRHIQRHDEKATINYTCSTCKRVFKHQAHLDNHILLVHTRDKGFTCEICLKSFTTKENLDIHKERHKIKKNHQCKVCFKAFCMMSTLKDHMRTHTGEKPYLCSTCGKNFSQKNNLTQHIKRHQGVKEFKCEHCEQRFVSKGELVAHNRKHSGAHPFVCDDCGNGFTTSSSMMKHRRIHTGERPYACDLCPMRFAASGTLKNHRRTHTNERPHQCTFCDKAFVQKNDMVAHVRCHTGDRPFVCNTCGQAFRKTSALKSHVKTHVREQKELSMLQGVNALLSGMQVEN